MTREQQDKVFDIVGELSNARFKLRDLLNGDLTDEERESLTGAYGFTLKAIDEL